MSSSATSFIDGGISLKNEGKPFFVNSKLLVDTGALMPSGIAISKDFFFQGMGGDSRRLGPSNFPKASGALANSTMKAVGQVDVIISMPHINVLFKGSAVVLENLSLPVILGVNFLKTNSLSTILEPDTAKLVHNPTNQEQVLIANIKPGDFQNNKPPSRSRPQTRQKRSYRSKNSPPRKFNRPPPPDFESAVDGAPVLLVRAAEHVIIPAKTARGINVQVPLNPADHVAIHPVQDDHLDGAVPAVYKHKNMQKAKFLSILYVNLNEIDITISKGQLVGHGSMCSEKKSSKPMVNVVKPDTIDPAVTEKLWHDLKLEDNEILKKNPKVKESFYSILNTYQNVFTSDQCSVGKTSWEEFKIELMPGARPVNQRVRPLPPPPQSKFKRPA